MCEEEAEDGIADVDTDVSESVVENELMIVDDEVVDDEAVDAVTVDVEAAAVVVGKLT